jgi:hypothetical protein
MANILILIYHFVTGVEGRTASNVYGVGADKRLIHTCQAAPMPFPCHAMPRPCHSLTVPCLRGSPRGSRKYPNS